MRLTYEDALRFLFPRTSGPIRWSSQPFEALLDALGRPERHFATVHIGGTNGKGSVAAMVYQTLREEGHSVGLYTSPHLVDVRERMMVDGRPATRAAFATWTERLQGLIETSGASFFEATTAIAFADFAARGADIVVVEVGLGGRLDTTNVVDPLASVVTSVGRDHVEYLGNSLDQVAWEKAGIAKPGRPFVVGESDPTVAMLLRGYAEARGATVSIVPPGERFTATVGLRGAHQQRNAAVARALLCRLAPPWRPRDDSIARGIADARLPGRFDRRGKWLFDVAHNLSAVEALVEAIRQARLPRPIHALFGALGDKEWRAMLHLLAAVTDERWLVTPPTAPRERQWDATAAEAARLGATWCDDFDTALLDVQRGAATVLVTGSFHTVGDALCRLPGFQPLG